MRVRVEGGECITMYEEWLTLSRATSHFCTNSAPLERAMSHYCTTGSGIFLLRILTRTFHVLASAALLPPF